jgi:hypothetical protein
MLAADNNLDKTDIIALSKEHMLAADNNLDKTDIIALSIIFHWPTLGKQSFSLLVSMYLS